MKLLTEQQSNIAKLRGLGMPHGEIAEIVGTTTGTVKSTLNALASRAVDKNRLELMRQVELSRMEELHVAYMEPALNGNKDAASVVLQVHDRKSKMMGLEVQANKTAPAGQVTFNMNFTGQSQPEIIEGEVVDITI